MKQPKHGINFLSYNWISICWSCNYNTHVDLRGFIYLWKFTHLNWLNSNAWVRVYSRLNLMSVSWFFPTWRVIIKWYKVNIFGSIDNYAILHMCDAHIFNRNDEQIKLFGLTEDNQRKNRKNIWWTHERVNQTEFELKMYTKLFNSF